MATKLNNNAEPQIAAVILQLERALFHLASAQQEDAVAVERVDDVSVHRGDAPEIQEQDKHSVQKGGTVLGDRSKGLWRTLQIWLTQIEERGALCTKYLIATNVVAEGKIASALRDMALQQVSIESLLQIVRTAGKGRRGTQIQGLIDDVLRRSDEQLAALFSRIELVERVDWMEARPIVANGLGVDPGVDQNFVVRALLGWVAETLAASWRSGQPGEISRKACLLQVHAIIRQLVRQRLLPRPASDVPISDAERAHAQTRDFVARLTDVRADDETVFEAIEHFLQFGAERHRLAAEGDIPLREWGDRGNRLRQRWRGVARQTAIEEAHRPAQELGLLILARTAFTHLEPIGQEPCHELYMTSGHYHRLADDNQIWWLPSSEGPNHAG
ncbi:ABC-three component system protein [Sphingomonas sp. NIBR02145]|uniref:ABC-three component system protein n=1 Tax=Sphingomonas sp. NIBR02145 TaxID=3014784 RepID=UPI0022B35676|nr:ABC-three component system protein [Sphingomonas sp. NIBR02145]WHU03664.1 hypothetical protein O3305_03410 [Sphingomonas sp. NIBR02145]